MRDTSMSKNESAAQADLTTSNSLTDLAARIRVEHEAAAIAMARGLSHAMAAGDLLLKAKAQLRHGEWPFSRLPSRSTEEEAATTAN